MKRDADRPASYVADRSCKFCSTYHIGDGWDTYATMADASANGQAWDIGSNTNINLSTRTRFGTGQSIAYGGNRTLTKAGSTNENTWFCATALLQTSVLAANGNGCGVAFYDGATAQCSAYFDSAGKIVVYSGDQSVVVATFLLAFVANSYDHWQFKFIIHPTAGEVHVRKNGASSDTFAATGINTRGGTANNYANAVAVRFSGGTGITQFMDDTLFYNGNGASAPNDWVGDVRAIQLQPTLDTAQKQFSQTTNGTSLVIGSTTNSSNVGIVAGRIQTGNVFTPTQGGTFTTATVEFNAGFSGNAKLGLYLADGDVQGFVSSNKPGTLVASSNALNNPVLGANTFTFPGTVSALKGYGYFFALLTDTNCTAKSDNFGGADYQYITPYAGGFPASLATLTTTVAVNFIAAYTTLTATNAGLSSDASEDGTVTYVSDNVVGHYDLYDLADLGYTPAAIIGVTLKSFVAKTDAGARGFKIAGKSGVTAFETAEYNPLTTFSPYQVFYPNDPDTSSPWTAAAVNALQIGPKISS